VSVKLRKAVHLTLGYTCGKTKTCSQDIGTVFVDESIVKSMLEGGLLWGMFLTDDDGEIGGLMLGDDLETFKALEKDLQGESSEAQH